MNTKATVMPCVDGVAACGNCDLRVPCSSIVHHVCKKEKRTKAAQRGLGDMIAAFLSAVGVTEERVSAIVGGDCGCKRRREFMNRVGKFMNRIGKKFGIGG